MRGRWEFLTAVVRGRRVRRSVRESLQVSTSVLLYPNHVAEQLGISQPSYALWERKEVALRPEQLTTLVNIYLSVAR